MVTHIARVWINRVRLPVLLVVSWAGKMNISLSAFVPENLVSRDEFGSPVPRQPAHVHTQAESGAYLRDSSRVPRRRPFMKPPYAIGSVPSLSGHAIAYRWRSLQRVADTGPVNLKVVPNECCLGTSPWTDSYSPLFPTPTIGMKWACRKYRINPVHYCSIIQTDGLYLEV